MRLQLTAGVTALTSMRLPLTALTLVIVAIVAWPSANVHADGRAATWLSVYSDDDQLTVVSPRIAVRNDLHEQVELSVGYDVDVITAATVDVTTAASPRGYSEERHAFQAAISWQPNVETKLGLSYLPSWEPDYRSHALSAQVSREWVDRRLTTKFDMRLIMDRVGRSGDAMSRWRDLTTPVAAASVSWILDPRTIGEIAYEVQLARGFMASPYRFVGVSWNDGSSNVAVPEAVPDSRTRHAIAANVRRALAETWYGRASYRFYVDDWGMTSHTGDVELQRTFANDNVLAGASLRGYRQSAASFHREFYEASVGMLPTLRSADKVLAQNWSVQAGLRLEASALPTPVGESLRAVLKLELYDQHFSQFAFLKRRRALIVSFGASVEY